MAAMLNYIHELGPGLCGSYKSRGYYDIPLLLKQDKGNWVLGNKIIETTIDAELVTNSKVITKISLKRKEQNQV